MTTTTRPHTCSDYAIPTIGADLRERMTCQLCGADSISDEFARALVVAIRADERLDALGDRQTVRDAMAQHDAHAALVRIQLAVGDMRSTFTASAIAQAFAQIGEER